MQKKCHVKTAVLVQSCSTYVSTGAGEESFPAWPGCQGQCIGSRGKLDNSHLKTQTCSPAFGQSPHLARAQIMLCAQVTYPKGFWN